MEPGDQALLRYRQAAVILAASIQDYHLRYLFEAPTTRRGAESFFESNLLPLLFTSKYLQYISNILEKNFRAQAVEEALRKDRDCPVEKETQKGKGTSGREEAQPPPPDVEAWSSSQC